MEKKIKKTSPKKSQSKTAFHFAYQEFIHVNHLTTDGLSEPLKEMVLAIEKQLNKAKSNCTPTHFKIIKESLQDFADILEGMLEQQYEDKIEGNIITSIPSNEQEIEQEETKSSLAQKILMELELVDRDYLSTSELVRLGVEGVREGKAIIVDELLLYREYLTNKWFIGNNPMRGGVS